MLNLKRILLIGQVILSYFFVFVQLLSYYLDYPIITYIIIYCSAKYTKVSVKTAKPFVKFAKVFIFLFYNISVIDLFYKGA